jgi:hypothetical protein
MCVSTPRNVLTTHTTISQQIDWLVNAGFTFYWAGTITSDYGPDRDVVQMRIGPQSANLVGSLCKDMMHRVAVDIDFDVADRICEILDMLELKDLPFMLVPSTTSGHWHLYVDKPMPWDEYEDLLARMVKLQIISAEYFGMSVQREMTRLRRPGVRKD